MNKFSQIMRKNGSFDSRKRLQYLNKRFSRYKGEKPYFQGRTNDCSAYPVSKNALCIKMQRAFFIFIPT